MIPRWATLQATLMLPALVWLYGWRTIDTVEWRTITAAPFSVTLDPSQQFLYGSPFIFLLGSYYQRQGLDFVPAFIVVHGLGLAFFGYALFRCLTHLCSASGRAAAVIVLAGSPLLFVVLTWIGKSDTYLLAFYLMLVTTRSRLTTAILCMLMIACHRELALAMLVGHVFLLDGLLAPTAIGAATGTVLSFLFTHGLLTSVPASRLDYLADHARALIRGVVLHPVVHLAATLGPFWIYMCRPPALTAARMGVLAMAVLLASLAHDFTRVFIIAATPLLLALTQEVVAELRDAGGVRLLGRTVSLGTLSWLALLQLQVMGAKVLWIRGVEWTLTR